MVCIHFFTSLSFIYKKNHLFVYLYIFFPEVERTGNIAKNKNFNKKDMNKYDESVWKLAASLILMKPKMDERQLFTLTRAPVILFHPDAMRTIVECWNWLLSARPDLELVFLQVYTQI